MRIRILPYRQGSRSARALADALGARVLRLEGSRFRPRPTDVAINWGRTEPYTGPMIMFNEPTVIRTVSNKLNFFNRMKEENEDIIPKFWTNKEDILDADFPIVCRTVLAGHSGEGIVIADTRDQLVDCSLYVQYVKKQDEYRIHVGKNNDGTTSIISQQRKARRQDCEDPNWRIRNHVNGFNFVRGDCNPPPLVTDVSIKALGASGLDFGAVDVIWNERQQRAYVLEINSAPGIESTTITDYVTYFRGQLQNNA